MGRCANNAPSDRKLATSAPLVTSVNPSRCTALSDAVRHTDAPTVLAMLVVSIHVNKAFMRDSPQYANTADVGERRARYQVPTALSR